MEYNKSLSARIRRRNKCGFSGLGTGKMIINGEVRSFNSVRASQMGDYTDPEQNGKASTYAIEAKRKAKLGFKRIARGFSLHKRALTKKFADNHQKVS